MKTSDTPETPESSTEEAQSTHSNEDGGSEKVSLGDVDREDVCVLGED